MKCIVCDGMICQPVLDTPYWECQGCNLWFQSPLPPKRFEAAAEKTAEGVPLADQMSDRDRAIVQHYAQTFWYNYVQKLPGPQQVLDLGCKYPWFLKCLQEASGGAVQGHGVDAMDSDPGSVPVMQQYESELGVPMLRLDFEQPVAAQQLLSVIAPGHYDAVSMIHVWEHVYDPHLGMGLLRSLLKPGGILLWRMPSHDVPGFQNHLSDRHYSIHPYFYCEKAIRTLVEQNGGFDLIETYGVGGGVRDFVLKRR